MQQVMPSLLYVALLNTVLVLLGYVLAKKEMIWQSWLMLVASAGTTYFLFLREAPVIRMLAMIVITFTAMKVVTVAVNYQHKPMPLTFKQWLSFTIGWAGMRPQPFEALGSSSLPNAWPMTRFGISRIIAGGFLLLLAHAIAVSPFNNQFSYILISATLLVGFSFILHFGLLSISAGIWRLLGVPAYYLFKQPAKARSLGEFWSKRWNLAFSEMTSIAIFRPLRKRTNNATGLIIAFLFSGLLHELALSVPVNSGYGLPLLYFFIQGIVVLVEQKLTARKKKFLQHPVTGRIWTFFWIVVPTPLLFHEQFIKEVLWPLAGLKV